MRERRETCNFKNVNNMNLTGHKSPCEIDWASRVYLDCPL